MKNLAKLIKGMSIMSQAGIYDTTSDTIQRTAIKMQEVLSSSKHLTEEAVDLAYAALQVFNNLYVLEVLDLETFNRSGDEIATARKFTSVLLSEMNDLLYLFMSKAHDYEHIYGHYCLMRHDVKEILDISQRSFVTTFDKIPSRIMSAHISLMSSYENLFKSFGELEDTSYDLYEEVREEFRKQNPCIFGCENVYGMDARPGDDVSRELLSSFPEHETISKSISELIWIFKDLHSELGEDFQRLEDTLRNTCLVADSYFEATLQWNQGGYEMIPSSALVWDIIRLKVARLMKRGFIFNDDILDAIKPLENEEA